ncbi:MAG: M48 family metallopeptidase [Zetaproteobacteria bacterium]|nr:M48 family metallopeptidase [Zetaproteobacteria bacterium]
MSLFTIIFIAVLAAKILMEVWLEQRHSRYVQSHRSAVPGYFSHAISLASHQKAADYTVAKIRLGHFEVLYGTLFFLFWTLGGGLDALDSFWHAQTESPVWMGLGFLLTFMLIVTLLDLPFEIYRTFVLEAKFGFNRTSVGLFLLDFFKQMLLMVLISAPLMALILWLMDSTGGWWWLLAWGLWSSVMLAMMWVYPTLIAPLFNKFQPLEEGELKDRIEALLERCGFSSQGLFVMDGSKRSGHGNAYFTGMGNAKRIVFFDTLIEKLTPEETEAVLAHELGHFKCHHIKKRIFTALFGLLIAFAILGFLGSKLWFYNGLGVLLPSNHVLLVLFMLAVPLFSFWLSPLSAMVSRAHEFEADRYATLHSDGKALASALVKLYEDNASTLTPDPLYSAWHDSHPPAYIRISAIETRLKEKPHG